MCVTVSSRKQVILVSSWVQVGEINEGVQSWPSRPTLTQNGSSMMIWDDSWPTSLVCQGEKGDNNFPLFICVGYLIGVPRSEGWHYFSLFSCAGDIYWNARHILGIRLGCIINNNINYYQYMYNRTLELSSAGEIYFVLKLNRKQYGDIYYAITVNTAVYLCWTFLILNTYKLVVWYSSLWLR